MELPELEPDAEEVLQVEDYADPVVKVCVEGPTRVQLLPTKSAGIRGITVGASAKRLLTADPHRARATIITDDVAIWIGGSQQEVDGGQPGKIPSSTRIDFGATDELWAKSAAAETTVCVMQERWANG
ncbi:hypothetical protein ACFTUC_41495 [Streptomyces sp. NPDC056944]|uniref:hypothetical protein n=1 Tax=Streptomyces sp. NPDC056944 TaxID=3345972 RepID=UPI00362664E0